MAGDATRLYWGVGTMSGLDLWAIAADATGVYWASNTYGQIMRFTW
jgi:hypothetical protein